MILCSWDAGCIHFVALNTESPIDTAYVSSAQVAWLEADLAAFATRRAAGRRAMLDADEVDDDAACTYTAPTFLIVYMHRPMYCSAGGKEGGTRCGKEADYLKGLVEDLFQKYAVDIVFAGHVHSCATHVDTNTERMHHRVICSVILTWSLALWHSAAFIR
jgi:hypothetical protein